MAFSDDTSYDTAHDIRHTINDPKPIRSVMFSDTLTNFGDKAFHVPPLVTLERLCRCAVHSSSGHVTTGDNFLLTRQRLMRAMALLHTDVSFPATGHEPPALVPACHSSVRRGQSDLTGGGGGGQCSVRQYMPRPSVLVSWGATGRSIGDTAPDIPSALGPGHRRLADRAGT